jgi:hypothetical protein
MIYPADLRAKADLAICLAICAGRMLSQARIRAYPPSNFYETMGLVLLESLGHDVAWVKA